MDGRLSHNNTNDFIQLDFIEEGRKNIFEWRDKRHSKRSGLRGRIYEITKLFIDRSLLRSFINNLSIVVGFQMLLAGFCTYVCVKLNLEFDVQMSLFVSPIVFPLAFSINANYQRREAVLEDLATFKAASLILFLCHRDWAKAIGLPLELLQTLSNKLKFLIVNIKEYLLTEDARKRQFILQAVYEDFSDVSQLNDKLRASELKSNSSLIARLVHCHNLMCWSFEKLRVIREYKSPRSLRSFTKVFIFLMPLLLSPYYVYRGHATKSYWAPYYISVLVSFLFGSLQAVQDKLDDPFDGISEDDVNLQQLEEWTLQSLLTNRTVHVGRFTVTTTSGQENKGGGRSPKKNVPPQDDIRIVSPKRKKRHTALRKSSSNAESQPKLDAKEFKNEMEARCHGIASKLEGMSGNTTIRPGAFLEVPKQSSPPALAPETGGREQFHLEVVSQENEEMGPNETNPSLSTMQLQRPALAKLFGSDIEPLMSDEETSYDARYTGVEPQKHLSLPSGQLPLMVPVAPSDDEKKPSVMDLFGLTQREEEAEESKAPQLAEYDELPSSHPNSPLTSHEDIPGDIAKGNVAFGRGSPSPDERDTASLEYAPGRRKRKAWSIPASWSKWRKRRQKKSVRVEESEEDVGATESPRSASTSLLSSDIPAGDEAATHAQGTNENRAIATQQSADRLLQADSSATRETTTADVRRDTPVSRFSVSNA